VTKSALSSSSSSGGGGGGGGGGDDMRFEVELRGQIHVKVTRYTNWDKKPTPFSNRSI